MSPWSVGFHGVIEFNSAAIGLNSIPEQGARPVVSQYGWEVILFEDTDLSPDTMLEVSQLLRLGLLRAPQEFCLVLINIP